MAQAHGQPPVNPAEIYEQLLVSLVFRPLTERVRRIASPAPGDRVLDVACGTGIVLREIAAANGDVAHLAGLDMNPAMLAVGRSFAEAQGIPVDWYEGKAEALPFDDRSFDWVYCQQGLQFLEDKAAALTEMHRVLDRDGRVVIVVWDGLDSHPVQQALNEASAAQTGVGLLETPFSLGDDAALTGLLEDNGFSDVEVTPVTFESRSDSGAQSLRIQLAGAFAAVPALQQIDETERQQLIDQTMAGAQPTIDAHTHDGVLSVTWNGKVAVARASTRG